MIAGLLVRDVLQGGLDALSGEQDKQKCREDLRACGFSFMQDGRRIDPQDVYLIKQGKE